MTADGSSPSRGRDREAAHVETGSLGSVWPISPAGVGRCRCGACTGDEGADRGTEAQVGSGCSSRRRFLLVCVSVVMVFSASALRGAGALRPARSLPDQAGAVGGAGPVRPGHRDAHRLPHLSQRRRDHRACWRSWALLLVAVLFSPPVNGSRRWFGLGGLGIQPSELAEVACVLFTAVMLERRMHRINEVSVLADADRHRARVRLAAGLILLQPDLGTALSLTFIVGVMVFGAGLSLHATSPVGSADRHSRRPIPDLESAVPTANA